MRLLLAIGLVTLGCSSRSNAPTPAPPVMVQKPPPVEPDKPPPPPAKKEVCGAVTLEDPLLAGYQLNVCQLPETERGEFPSEYRLAKAGAPWISHLDVASPTGGYNSASETQVEFAGKRFLAITMSCDAVGTGCVLVFDLEAKSATVVDCPENTCGGVKTFKESGNCPIVVECRQCVFEGEELKPTLRKEELCEP